MTLSPTGLTLSRRLLPLLPWVILALGLGATDMLRHSARQDTGRVLEAEFQSWVNKLTYHIESGLNKNVQVLRGVASLFNASETVTRQGFRRYVAGLHLEESYPGIQGIGFSRWIPSDQKAAHEAAIRQEGFPDYVIRPAGEREFYTSVVYLEPFIGRNLRAFGYDMGAEPVRWTAAVRARDTGHPTLSGKVMLQQETATDIQPGVLLFVPVYRANAPHDSLDERRANLTGWAFSPFRMYDLMHNLLQTVEFDELRSALNVEIYDGVHLSPDAQLFTLHSATPPSPDPAFQAIRRLLFGGHPWSLRVTSTPPFDARQSNEKARLIAIAGGVGSVLLALLVGVLTSSQVRITAALGEAARNIAERQRVEDALRESETRFRSYFELPLIGIAVTSVDKGWLEINDRLCEMLGYSRQALQQKTWVELTYPDDLAADVALFNQLQAGKIQSYSLEKRFIRADNRVLPAQLSVAGVRAATGQLRYCVALVQDITERRRAEDALRLSLTEIQRHDAQMMALNRMNDRLLSCETCEEAYTVIAHSTGQLFATYHGSLAICRETSAELDRVVSWGEQCSVRQRFRLDSCWALRLGELHEVANPSHDLGCTHFANPPENAYLCVPLIVRGQTMGLLHVGANDSLTDKSFGDLRTLVVAASESIKLALSNLQLREALREQAIRDPLTGLFNRRYLDETLHRELHRCQRDHQPLVVAMLDIDHFKHFNDVYGHDAGDAVLHVVGGLLRRSLRTSDIACRYGGEELTLILPGSTRADAVVRLESLRHTIQQQRTRYRDTDLPVITVSIGVAAMRLEDTDATALLGRADAALYQAKDQGRNRLMVAEDT